jgi:hypothetical protein
MRSGRKSNFEGRFPRWIEQPIVGACAQQQPADRWLVPRGGEHERGHAAGVSRVEVIAAINVNLNGAFDPGHDGHPKELAQGADAGDVRFV